MADANSSPAPRPYAPPMASPGYGKRSTLDQRPRHRADFTHLPPREAAIAAHIDRLPDGAAVDTKTLARELPAYGQQAVRSALSALSRAGHLRRVRETVGEGRTQWVYRTYFSRTARDDAWWAAFLAGDTPNAPAGQDSRSLLPVQRTAREAAEPRREAPHQGQRQPARPARSAAYETLATLGGTDPRMVLSASECAELEPLATEWLTRGVTKAQLIHSITAGLPPHVHSPAALARRRLIDKLPPEPVPAPVATDTTRRIMECTACGVPGRPEALPGGLCRPCRGGAKPSAEATGQATINVRAQMVRLRAAARTPAGTTPHG